MATRIVEEFAGLTIYQNTDSFMYFFYDDGFDKKVFDDLDNLKEYIEDNV